MIFLAKCIGLWLELDNYLKLREMLIISVNNIKSVQIAIKCQGVCINATNIFCLLMYLFLTITFSVKGIVLKMIVVCSL